MPVIYISQEHYNKLIRQGEVPKDVVKKLLKQYLKEDEEEKKE